MSTTPPFTPPPPDYLSYLLSPPPPPFSSQDDSNNVVQTTFMTLGFVVSGILVISVAVFLIVRGSRSCQTKSEDPESLTTEKQIDQPSVMENFLNEIIEEKPTKLSYEKLKEITENFKHVLGKGGFGVVYKGKLQGGVLAAIKVLNQNFSEKLIKKQFKAEVNSIGRTHHFNLVKLYGFCFEDRMKALIYEFMEKGSLDNLLFRRENTVEWGKLHEIAIGTAKGIAYLHEDCQKTITHYDIKPENILLDWDFSPKVADFGLARLCNRDATHVTPSCFKGTVGYAAPELFTGFHLTCKCDVYSYGMVLFEILGRRRNFSLKGGNSSEDWLPRFVWKKFEDGLVREMLEGFGIEERNIEKGERMVMIALWCVQYQPALRPRMSSVVKMLEGEVRINPPTNPFPNFESGLAFDAARLEEFGDSNSQTTSGIFSSSASRLDEDAANSTSQATTCNEVFCSSVREFDTE